MPGVHMVSYTWALNDCFPLRLPSYIYRRNVGVTCLFHDFKSYSFEGDFYTLFFILLFFFSNATTCSYELRGFSLLVVAIV